MNKLDKVIKSELRQRASNLTKTENIIHDFVLTHPEQVIYSSISQVASRLNVGDASVVRYFKSLGFNNFVEFKMHIFKIFETSNEFVNKTYIEQIYENFNQSIKDTVANLDVKKIDVAANKILKSNKVLLGGMGLSNISAQALNSRLTRIGINCEVASDSHLLFMRSSNLSSNDIFIGYSFTGETKEIIRAVEIAKENECFVIIITNFSSSTLADLSDISLVAYGFEKNIESGFFGPKMAQIFLTDILITRLAMLRLEKSLEAVKKTTKALMKEE